MRIAAIAASLAMVIAALALPRTAAAADARSIAVILLHGGGSSGSQFDDMRPLIEKAGYRLVTPDMCWAESRRYDESAEACLSDVDKVVARLKGEGYQRIV